MVDVLDNRQLTWEILEAEGRRRGRESWQEWILEACPIGDWPQRRLVDLDDVGDPGFWIQDNLCGEELLNDPSVDKVIADDLAQSYLRTQSELWLESYADMCESDEEYQYLVGTVEDDFLAFIQEWRRIVWKAIAE